MNDPELNLCVDCEKPIQFAGLCSRCLADDERINRCEDQFAYNHSLYEYGE